MRPINACQANPLMPVRPHYLANKGAKNDRLDSS